MREMRRKDRMMTPEEAEQILRNECYGILATVGSDRTPYGVPLNYAYADGALYFHCAPIGHKLDNIAQNSAASFTVVASAQVLPETFSTHFKSVIAFGNIFPVNGEEKKKGLIALIEKYSPDYMEEGLKCMEKTGEHTTVLKLEISGISGKDHE
ncbi:MAG: pyridoxamine 5'-phosphate oxidase family protein [Candidatus Limivivens sp.]|nr:pyridoxamine 5'-phosphate oxidase family protein [Candidatus Limivivens sp.]